MDKPSQDSEGKTHRIVWYDDQERLSDYSAIIGIARVLTAGDQLSEDTLDKIDSIIPDHIKECVGYEIIDNLHRLN